MRAGDSTLAHLQRFAAAVDRAEDRGRPLPLDRALTLLDQDELVPSDPTPGRRSTGQLQRALLRAQARDHLKTARGPAIGGIATGLGMALGLGATGPAILFITGFFGIPTALATWGIARSVRDLDPPDAEVEALKRALVQRRRTQRGDVDTSALGDPESRRTMTRALEHVQAVARVVDPERASTTEADALDRMLRAVGELFAVCVEIDAFEGNAWLQDRLRSLPREVRELEDRVAAARRPMLKRPLQRDLEAMRDELQQLHQLEAAHQRRLDVREHLGRHVGLLASQFLRLSALRGQDGRRQRFMHELTETSNRLQDVVDARAEINDEIAARLGDAR